MTDEPDCSDSLKAFGEVVSLEDSVSLLRQMRGAL